MRSTDPAFEEKAADIIGLYVQPPQHAAVFCLDEKTAIQALDRLDPVLPLSPGRAERHGFEYSRHGTLSLYAALNNQTGEVLGQPRRAAHERRLRGLPDAGRRQPARRGATSTSSSTTCRRTRPSWCRAFLAAHPHVQLHFTPTYSSWLNQVELWFAKIERDILARGIFTSVKDLARKIRRYIDRYNRDAKPFRWTCTDPTRRIAYASHMTLTVH